MPLLVTTQGPRHLIAWVCHDATAGPHSAPAQPMPSQKQKPRSIGTDEQMSETGIHSLYRFLANVWRAPPPSR